MSDFGSLYNSKRAVLVCIPAYNAAESLVKTVKSILGQTLKDADILIIDNQSEDETVEVAEKLKDDLDKENRVHIVVNEEGLGRIGNWNKCLDFFKKSRHEYLKLVFTGDTLENNCLEVLAATFRANRNVGMVVSGYYMHVADKASKKRSFPNTRHFTSEEALSEFVRGNWVGAPVSCMFSRRAVEPVRFMDGVPWTSDWRFYIDIASQADSVYIPDLLGNFFSKERKHFLEYSNNPSIRAEEFFIKHYVVLRLKEINANLAKICEKKLLRDEGKYLFPKLPLYEIFWLTLYKFMKHSKRIFKQPVYHRLLK